MDCDIPDVNLSLEKSEYTVEEVIDGTSRALQVCAVGTDILFPVEAHLEVHDGSAEGNMGTVEICVR